MPTASPPVKKNKEPPATIPMARARTTKFLPYMAQHVMSLIPVERPGLGTFGVDKWMRMYYDPALLSEWSLDVLAAVVLHEDLHILLRHHVRAEELFGAAMTGADQLLWNLAGDCVINTMLKEAGLKLPEGVVYPENFGFPTDLSTERYYELLKAEAEKHAGQYCQCGSAGQQQGSQCDGDGLGEDGQGHSGGLPGGSQSGRGDTAGAASRGAQGGTGDVHRPGKRANGRTQGSAGADHGHGDPDGAAGSGVCPQCGQERFRSLGNGSSADGQQRPWEMGPPGEGPAQGISRYEQTLIEKATAEEIESYARKGRGTLPGCWTRLASEILRPKVDPWRELLASVKYAVTATNGHGDFTYRKLARRQPVGSIRLPAHIQPLPKVLVLVDTSGSMGQKDLGLALGIIRQGLRAIPRDRLTVAAADTEIHVVSKVFRAEDCKLSGGGGTDVGHSILQAVETIPGLDVIICVTDGITPWPAAPIRQRVVALLTRECDSYPVPAWIKKIVINPE